MKKVILLMLSFFSLEMTQACCFKKKKEKIEYLHVNEDNTLQIGKNYPMILTEKDAIFYLTGKQNKTILYELLMNNPSVLTLINNNNETPVEMAIMHSYIHSLEVFVEYLSEPEKKKYHTWEKNHTNRKEVLELLKNDS